MQVSMTSMFIMLLHIPNWNVWTLKVVHFCPLHTVDPLCQYEVKIWLVLYFGTLGYVIQVLNYIFLVLNFVCLKSQDCLSFCAVSGRWPNKNAVGKPEIAKLVDDIYRCVLSCILTLTSHSCSNLSRF